MVVQRLKHLPAMRETWVRPLGREDPLEKEMATHSSIIAGIIPWIEEPGWPTVHGGHKEPLVTEQKNNQDKGKVKPKEFLGIFYLRYLCAMLAAYCPLSPITSSLLTGMCPVPLCKL